MSNYDILALVLSWLAVVASSYFAVQSNRSAKRSNSIQSKILDIERVREMDRQSAAVAVKWGYEWQSQWDQSSVPGGGLSHLILSNEGPGTALEVQIILDGHPARQFPGVQQSPELGRVAAGASVTYDIALDMDTPELRQIEIRWNDELGNPQQWITCASSS